MSSDLCTAAMSSAAVGAISCSSKEPQPPLSVDGREKEGQLAEESGAVTEEHVDAMDRKLSESSLCRAEEAAAEEEEEEEGKAADAIDLGPRISIKDQLEKDKDDESLRRWKEQLLGSVNLNSVGETLEPDVKIMSLSILSPARPDIFLPLPVEPNSKGVWFTLKEGSAYRLKFTFSVSSNIVSGLRYTNTVWKTGIKVDSTKEMLGTFSPQLEPYTYVTPEETTPSGMFARGSYSGDQLLLRYPPRVAVELSILPNPNYSSVRHGVRALVLKVGNRGHQAEDERHQQQDLCSAVCSDWFAQVVLVYSVFAVFVTAIVDIYQVSAVNVPRALLRILASLFLSELPVGFRKM